MKSKTQHQIINLNYEQLKKFITEGDMKLELTNCRLNITINECEDLIYLANKEIKDNKVSWNKSMQYYDKHRDTKKDYAITDGSVFIGLMVDISRQQDQADQAFYNREVDLTNVRTLLGNYRFEKKLNQKKQALAGYLERQINRLHGIDPNSAKELALKEIQKNIGTITKTAEFNQILSGVRKEVRNHRETDLCSMIFKFNWFRNTKSQNQLNQIFDERNELLLRAD